MQFLKMGQVYRIGGDVYQAGTIGHVGEEKEVLFDLVAEEWEDDPEVYPDIVLTVDQVGRLWRLESAPMPESGRVADFWASIGVALHKTSFTVDDLVVGDIDLDVWGNI